MSNVIKYYHVVFDCQLKEMPLIMQPAHAYVFARNEKEAEEQAYATFGDEDKEKLNITLAAVIEEYEQ